MTVVCARCEFYFVTHYPNSPWGCRKFGFKSKILPNFVVRQATGMECAYYNMKKVKTHSKEVKNGNAFIK